MQPPLNFNLYSSLMNYHFIRKINNNPNTLNHKVNQFECDIIFSTYMKCLVGQSINCEKIHDQFEKCLYFNNPNQE
jgi:hypothetical protein